MNRLRALIFLFLLTATLHAPGAVMAAKNSLPGSIQPVDDVPPTAADPHKPYITRRALRAEEMSQPMSFEVVLQMRNFAELQQRVAKGERISAAEMAAKYQPSAADYQKVVAWLTQEGFTIRKQDPSHLAVFASGTVKQLQQNLGLTFGRVKRDNAEYTSALTAPIVPADIGALVVGINGLQPHLRLHRHIIRKNSTSGAGPPFEPIQLAQAYDASALYGYNIKGDGQTIAIAIDTFPLMSDLTAFWSDFGVDRGSATVTFIQVVSGTLAAMSGEETLDTEWSSSIAPHANVRVYASTDLEFSHLDEVYAQIYSDVVNSPALNIHEMSMSFGAAEIYVSTSQLTTDAQYYAEITAAGVTIFASTGDVGATPNSDGTAGGSFLTPEYPSSDPNVAGVGGTTLTVDANGNPSSEVVWNNGTGATGGGISRFFSRPTWQTGTGVSTSSKRQTPDIASAADPNTGAYIIENGQAYEIGGTSWSSPTWAGFAALLNQARANANEGVMGLLGPFLYPQIGTANFRDITSGNNKFDSTRGYNAGTGYDLCTGCGVPDVTTLAKTISGSSTLAPLLLSAASVQLHNGTAFSIPLPLTGTPAIEPRRVNGALQLVFTFVQPVVSGAADVTDGNGTVSNVNFSGATMTVNLTGVDNAQDITVTLSEINGTTATDEVTLGVLLGDVNGDGGVNAQDVTIDRNAVGTVATDSGFNPRTDLNLDGGVNAQDVTIDRNAVGTFIP